MNGHGESDRVIVPGKLPNKGEVAEATEPAEAVEERTLTKENLRQQNTHRTRGRKRVHSVLARVRRAAEGSAWGVSSSTAGTHHSGSTTPIPTTGSASESEAGAQCGSPARWDLCGGRPERAVPTATARTIPQRHHQWAGFIRLLCVSFSIRHEPTLRRQALRIGGHRPAADQFRAPRVEGRISDQICVSDPGKIDSAACR